MEKKVLSIIFWLCAAALIVGGGLLLLIRQIDEEFPNSVFLEEIPEAPLVLEKPVDTAKNPDVVPPLTRSSERVTKKPFGIYIDRATSPVQPERFVGYHTGTDFEVFPDEAVTEVVVVAICAGEVMAKRMASGYGGLLVTRCTIDGQRVTAIYGHLLLSSISVKVGEKIATGERVGVLGAAGSRDTDGERKHLHLSIHLGDAVNILGYAANEKDLSRWLNPCLFVCGR